MFLLETLCLILHNIQFCQTWDGQETFKKGKVPIFPVLL